MQTFNYHKPDTLEAAVELLRDCDEPSLLAGGHTILPAMKQRLAAPGDVVDLAGIPGMSGIETTADGVRIGAMTCHADVAASGDVLRAIPALAALAGGIGDPQVSYRGTTGGSVANNDPAADYPAAVLGLDATIDTDRRRIAADAFFRGMFETALAADEIITGLTFPVPDRAAYVKFPNPASRYAIVGAFIAVRAGGVRVAITGAAPCVFRWQAAEAALGENLAQASLANVALPADDLNADLHASAEYRAHLANVMVARAVAAL